MGPLLPCRANAVLIDQTAAAIARFEQQAKSQQAHQGEHRNDSRTGTSRATLTTPKNQTVRHAQSQCSDTTAWAIPGSQIACDAARPVTYAATAPAVPNTYSSVATFRSSR